MAINLGTAVLSLTTDDAGLQSGLRGAQNIALGASVAIVGVLAGIGAAALKVGFDFNSMQQQAMIGLETMLGGAENALGFMNELKAFAASTPFELPGLIKSSQKLLAFGFTAESIIPMLTSIGDAVSALGGGEAEINRVTMAMGQMKAKGKVQAEEMMQLAELGIPAWDMLAKAIGVGVPEAMAMVSKGAVKADVAIAALTKGMDEKFGGMMSKQSRTMAGLMSTLRDTISQTAGQLTAPIFEKASQVFATFMGVLSSPAAVAGLAAITLGIESLVGLLSEADPEKRIEFFNKLASVVGGDTAEKIALITSGIIGLVGGLTGVADSGERVYNALVGLVGTDLANFITGAASAIGAIIAPIADAVGQFVAWQDVAIAVGILLAAVLIPAVISLVAALWPVIAVFAAIVLAVAVLRTAWENDFLGIATTLTAFWTDTAQPILGQIGDWLSVETPKAVAAAKQAWDELVKFWQSFVIPAIETMIGNFQRLFEVAGKVKDGDFLGALNVATTPTGGGGTSGAGFAEGTDNAPPGLHWVGEKGPELMRFAGGEQVIPNNRIDSLLATPAPSLNYSPVINTGVDRRELDAALERERREVFSKFRSSLVGAGGR